jgi:hypothetical protein
MNRTPRRIRQSRYEELYARKAQGLSTRAQIGMGILIVAAFMVLALSVISFIVSFARLQPVVSYCRGMELFAELILFVMALRGNVGARNLLAGWMLFGATLAAVAACLLAALSSQLTPELADARDMLVGLTIISAVVYGGLALLMLTPMVNAYLDEC